jgi:hypothetical protein
MTRQRCFAPGRTRLTAAVVLLVGLLCFGGSRSLAGQLDGALLRKGGYVLEYLNDKGYRNVGVLPFQVKKGSRPVSFEDAPVSLNLTTRLENTLIVSQNPAGKTIGVIRNASGTANRNRVGPYRTSPSAFSKLFAQKYDLAWGGRKVKADAFLTGRVVNAGKGRARTSVVVEVFDSRSMKGGKLLRQRVCKFDLPTDRALLGDLGYAWALSPTVLSRGFRAADRDRLALRQVAGADETGEDEPQPGQSNAHTPENVAGFRFEIFYDKKQRISPLRGSREGQRLPLYQVPPAPPGSDVVMVLTRIDESDRTLGVVLKVNGLSTWRKEDAENILCRKWLYDPDRKGKPDRFLGFYLDVKGKNLLKFRSLTAEESEARASALGNRVGWIDIEVFASKEESDEKEEDAPVKKISTRGVPRGLARGAGLRAVQAAISKTNNFRVKPVKLPFGTPKLIPRTLIDAEVAPLAGGEFEWGELPRPESLGSLSIRYHDRGRQ